jgi:hypothetical protein
MAAKDCVIAGFLRGELFYTREQASRASHVPGIIMRPPS